MKSSNLNPVVTQDSEQLLLEEMPITKHLIILRGHLFKIVGLILILFFCLLNCCTDIKCYIYIIGKVIKRVVRGLFYGMDYNNHHYHPYLLTIYYFYLLKGFIL